MKARTLSASKIPSETIDGSRLSASDEPFGDRPAMRSVAKRDKTQLRFRQIESYENEHFSRFVVLSETVFGATPKPAWPVMAFVDGAGHCVAGLQHRILRLSCDGAPFAVGAIRNVAVAPEWRGLGVMQDLMARVLPWCDARVSVTLLYAETPLLYARLGFATLPQHAFEADAPEPTGPSTARPLVGRGAAASTSRLLAARTPASLLCGVLDEGGMAEQSLSEGRWPLFYDPTLDALIVHEIEDETLVLVDVIAARIPTASRILGALGARPKRMRTLFPPDKLAWAGVPVPEDAGLMARGTLPPAMRRPFILPPTFEF